MNTCVLCLSLRNDLQWSMRSRSRWKPVRRGQGAMGVSRPRERALKAASGLSMLNSSASRLFLMSCSNAFPSRGAAAYLFA